MATQSIPTALTQFAWVRRCYPSLLARFPQPAESPQLLSTCASSVGDTNGQCCRKSAVPKRSRCIAMLVTLLDRESRWEMVSPISPRWVVANSSRSMPGMARFCSKQRLGQYLLGRPYRAGEFMLARATPFGMRTRSNPTFQEIHRQCALLRLAR